MGLGERGGRRSGGKRKREGGMGGKTVIGTEEMSPERKRKWFIEKIESYRYTPVSKVFAPPPPPPIITKSGNPSFTSPPPTSPRRGRGSISDIAPSPSPTSQQIREASTAPLFAGNGPCAPNNSGERKKEEAVTVEDKASKKKKKAKPDHKGKGSMMGEDEESGAKGEATTKSRKSEAKMDKKEGRCCSGRKREGGMTGIEMEEMSPEKKWFFEKIESYRYTGGSKVFTPPPPPPPLINTMTNPSFTPPPACLRRKRRVIAPRPRNAVNENKSGAASKRKPRAPAGASTTITSNDKSRKRKKEEAVAVDDKAAQKKKKAKPDRKGEGTMMGEDEQSGAKTKAKGKAKGKGKATAKSKKPRSILTAAEKRSDAYVRVPEDHPWVPPATGIDLLQLPFHRDHWKVLVICILLNQTSGVQVTKMLNTFFKLCPNAETAKDVCDEKLRLILRDLGLQQSRTRIIKRFSHEYVEGNWSYVTELHGIGKYGADAYAIVCAGKPEKVIPEDHRLVPYWKSVLESQGKTIPSVIGDGKKGRQAPL